MLTLAAVVIGNHSAATRHDARRLASLSAIGSRTSSFQTLVENGSGAYLVNLSIGSPPLAFPAILDTGSDLTRTQCAPCPACFAQPTPLYDPSNSSTFSKLPCASPECRSLPGAFRACDASDGCAYDYHYTVGYTAGYLDADTVALDGASLPGVAFGCSAANGGPMDKCRASWGSGVARCPSFRSSASAPDLLRLRGERDGRHGGAVHAARSESRGRRTTTSTSPASRSAILTSLSRATRSGSRRPDPGLRHDVRVPHRSCVRDGEAGVPVADGRRPDEGERCIVQLRPLLRRRRQRCRRPLRRRAVLSDACSALRWRRRAEYVVPRKSYFDGVEEQGRAACLLLLPTKGVSVVGNVMQMDLHVLYDLDGGVLSFAPMDCASA